MQVKRELLSVAVAALLLTSCASTKVLNVWKDDGLQEREYSSVLVLGVIKEPAYRRLFENRMVQSLRNAGVDAHASYDIFPDTDLITEAVAVEQVQARGIDAVLVTRTVDTRNETVYTPGTTYVHGMGGPWGRRGWYGYYGGSYEVMQTPGYTTEYSISTVETHLFDVAAEKPAWTAITETSETSVNSAIESYVKAIAKPLRDSGLF
jgi:hypothetical protein